MVDTLSWSLLEPYVLAVVGLAPYISGRVDAWISARAEREKAVIENRVIPRIWSEKKRRKLWAANVLYTGGGTMVVLALGLFGLIGLFLFERWLSPSFPWQYAYVTILLLELTGIVIQRVGWRRLKADPSILDAWTMGLGAMGTKPGKLEGRERKKQVAERRLGKLTAREPDPEDWDDGSP